MGLKQCFFDEIQCLFTHCQSSVVKGANNPKSSGVALSAVSAQSSSSSTSSCVNSEMVVDDNSSSNPRSRPTVTGAGVDTNSATTTTPSTATSPVAPTKEKNINEELTPNKTEKLANSSNGRNRTGAEKTTQDQGDKANDKETKQVRLVTLYMLCIQTQINAPDSFIGSNCFVPTHTPFLTVFWIGFPFYYIIDFDYYIGGLCVCV